MKDWGFQLYSARFNPLRQSLDMIAAAGYKSVEAVGANFEDVNEFKAGLDASGLSVPSAHVSRERLANSMDQVLEQAQQFGIQHIVVPHIVPAERPQDAAGWAAMAQELAGYSSACRDAGLDFAYHNHDFEFVPLDNAAIPMRILLDGVPEMQWEIDVAWIVRAGVDPVVWIDEYLQRISAVHVKDLAPNGECVDEGGWADVGHGVMDWPDLLLRLRESPAKLFIMEHDKPADAQRFASRSIERANTW